MKNLLYYFSVGYLAIAGLIYVITLLIIFLDKKKRYFNHIASLTSSHTVQIITALVTPVIFALGWLFLFPFVSVSKK